MKKATLLRPTKLTERQGLWLVVALVVSVPLLLIALAASEGALESVDPYWFARVARGYTFIGLTLGILAVFFVLLTFGYSIRKRRRPSGKSATMMTWLWIHVYGGLLAFVLATVHAGPGVISVEFSSGKLLWFALAVVVVTGVAWRLVYALVPPVAGPQVVNYSKAGSARRATEQETEIEKLAAGKSPQLHEAKAMLLAAPRSQQEIAALGARIPPPEQPLLGELVRLAAARHRALGRVKLQDKYTRVLQGWRVFHVPVTLLIVVLLVVHVVGALELPQKVLAPSTGDGALAGFAASPACKDCHAAIYTQWSQSMHAHALTSPLTVAQNNLDVRISLKGAPSPDPKRICIQCHAPAGGLSTSEETLPLPGGLANNDGISCASCHSHATAAQPGTGGFRQGGLLAKLEPGRKYYGPLASPVGNAFHKSEGSPMFAQPETICASCHNVNLDRDHDGKIVKGVDLVLQTTYDEWGEYKAAGGTATCVTCHMPVVANLTRAADSAFVPFEQDRVAPPRVVHDHSFVGVDYPLDTVVDADPQLPARQALLRSAASMVLEGTPTVEGGKLKFQIALTNTTGHNLPTGFAFARQMWMEVQASGAGGEALFSSGKLLKNANDLCDAATLDDELKKHVVGCDAADPQLVNIQLKLIDRIAVLPDAKNQPSKDERGEYVVVGGKDAHETVLQHPEGGAIARKRPATKEALVPLHPLEKRVFTYAVPLSRFVPRGTGALSVRLLFRNIPPYFVRAMSALQAEGEPKVATLVDRLQVVEMSSVRATF